MASDERARLEVPDGHVHDVEDHDGCEGEEGSVSALRKDGLERVVGGDGSFGDADEDALVGSNSVERERERERTYRAG